MKDMKAAVGFAHTPVGHAFVVKALLQGDFEVIDGKIIDHVGMLMELYYNAKFCFCEC
jgi:hypothetical protein